MDLSLINKNNKEIFIKTETKDTIVFDVDGILINWLSQLPFFCVRMGIDPKMALKNYTRPKHLPASELFGIQNERIANDLLRKYNLEHGKYMTAFPDAVDHLHKLAKEYNLVALTKFGSSVEHYTVRKYNLETFFPGCFSELISIDYHEDKSSYFTQIANTHSRVIAFVDDQLEYIEDVRSHHPDVNCIHLNRYDDNADIQSVEQIYDLL